MFVRRSLLPVIRLSRANEASLFPSIFWRKKACFLEAQRVPEKEPPASSLEWVKSLQRVNPWFCGKAGRAVHLHSCVKSLRRGNPLLGEEAAPVLSPKPPTCSHSAVVASAAKGQLSLGSLNPKRRSVERVGAARTARAGKEAGRPFRPPLSSVL